jgi:acetyl-CoA carboxylase biotin carboxyl carrier protein
MDGHNRHNSGSHSDEHIKSAGVISIKQLQHLVRQLDRSDVTELELNRPEEGIRLVLRKVKASPQNEEQAIIPAQVVVNESPSPETKHNVVAPLVGVFHAAAKPKGKPLVSVGDQVKAGQHVAAIESLNIINEVEAPVTGRIVEILIEEGQAVEYGQPLMTIDSAEGA